MSDAFDELVDIPPEEFVAARTQLAARLKSEGHAAEAAQVKKLRKPSVRQWLVDQVRRHHTAEVDALRAASSDVAQAQEDAITGGDRDALRDATAKRRDAVGAVGRAVDEIFARYGRPATHREEVLAAVESAVTEEVASGTFGVRDDLEVPDRPKREPRIDRAAERRAASARAAIEAAEARVRRARDELDKAQGELEAIKARYGTDA
jgi:hypothetical protein